MECVTSQYSDLVGLSNSIKEIRDIIEKIANTDLTVLLTGESGTGKEVVARTIHQTSARKSKPFIKINCAALPDTLLESELFGYEKGAFSGATIQKPGRFELAGGGTILLDEIGEMTLGLQAKLLEVLQDKHFTRLGGCKNTSIDVRIIAATNRNIEKCLTEASFRPDLFFRLNEVTIHIPPLREHKEDIPTLCEHFLQKYNCKYNKTYSSLGKKMTQRMMYYDWPGNVRELENLLKRMVALGNGECAFEELDSLLQKEDNNPTNAGSDKDHLPDHDLLKTQEKLPLKEISRKAMCGAEEAVIKYVLTKTHWNRVKAARMLDISYKALRYKIEQYGLVSSSTS